MGKKLDLILKELAEIKGTLDLMLQHTQPKEACYYTPDNNSTSMLCRNCGKHQWEHSFPTTIGFKAITSSDITKPYNGDWRKNDGITVYDSRVINFECHTEIFPFEKDFK